MKFLAALFALVGIASAGLAPVLLPKVNVAPTQVNIVRQPVQVTQPELVYRNVPVPIRAVAYTNPIVQTPVVHAAPVIAAHSIGVPAISAHSIGVPAISAHSIGVPAISAYSAPLAHAPLNAIW